MNTYERPDWSGLPTTLYTLEVLKDGVSLEELSLADKQHFMLGRGDDSDIVLAHPSVSRYHAVLQHNTDGDLFLYDLASTHGTQINGKLVEPKAFVQVYSGDTIRFAGSSRTYLVNGPEDKQRPAASKLFSQDGRLLVTPQSRKTVVDFEVTRRRVEDDYRRQKEYEMQMKARLQEVSWGFDEDAKEAAINPQDKILYEDVLDLEQVKMRGDVTERHQRQITLIEEKRRKLDSLQREITTLTRKSDDQEEGLTRGQTQRLSKAQGKLKDLQQEVELEEETLRNMFLESESGPKHSLPVADSSDDDEYFNRVAKKPKTIAENTELTYDEALQQYQAAVQSRDKLVQALSGLSDSKTGEEEEDEFEAYMQANRDLMNEENRTAIAAQMKELNETVERLHGVLARLNSGAFSQYIREKDAVLQVVKKPVKPPSPPKSPEQESFQKPQKFTVTSKPAPRNVVEDFSVSTEELETAYGTASVPESVKKSAETKLQWQPPKGQTGDGRTALNEKYKY